MSKSALIAVASAGLLAAATTPPIPPRVTWASNTPTVRQIEPDFAGAGPDDGPNLCLMFKTTFLTQTNWIYRLEWSPDLRNWLSCQPEIDGTGNEDYFFDVNQGCRSYRIVTHPGQLP